MKPWIGALAPVVAVVLAVPAVPVAVPAVLVASDPLAIPQGSQFDRNVELEKGRFRNRPFFMAALSQCL
jgi:hypothetical protein